MKRCVVAAPHSHTWLWTQTCLEHLRRHPPKAEGVECVTVVVDNSWDWSPSALGVTETRLGEGVEVLKNYKANKFHASALDCVVETYGDYDYLMALETDVLVLEDGWLGWFLSQLGDGDYAVGHWHHEQFVNPSCTLYRMGVLRQMHEWCKALPLCELRWGERFEKTGPVDHQVLGEEAARQSLSWIAGAFAEKRGWPEGTRLKVPPSGQTKGPGWYEPGQQLHHWAVEDGWGYCVCPTTTHELLPGLPVQTLYGGETDRRTMEVHELWGKAWAAHCWGGTRALDILKHPVEDQFVRAHMPFWLAREARFWRDSVPRGVQEQTVKLIRRHGWHTRDFFGGPVTDRCREAVKLVEDCYREGQVFIAG